MQQSELTRLVSGQTVVLHAVGHILCAAVHQTRSASACSAVFKQFVERLCERCKYK